MLRKVTVYMKTKTTGGRPPKGDQSIIDVVREAVRAGCRTVDQVQEYVDTKVGEPVKVVGSYVRRLERRGEIRKVRSFAHAKSNQHCWEWEWPNNMTSDYCGQNIGFRVSEADKTVQIIYRSVSNQWTTLGQPRTYPITTSDIPTSAINSGGAWELAWALLAVDSPAVYEQLKKMLVEA